MATFPSKVNYATGDVLTATNMNDVGGALNLLESAQFAAGKNKIINGDFGIWQRGTTVTDPAGGTLLADRFVITYDGTAPTSRTYSQQTFTAGTAPVAGYEGKFFARVAVTTKGSNTRTGLYQAIESVRTFAGQTVTISFWAKCDSARTGAILVQQNFGTGGSPSATVTVTDSAVSYTASWARYSLTLAIPSIAGKTLGTAGNDLLNIQFFHTSANGSTFDIWGVQVEAASTASPFQTASGSIGGELALCHRYYYRTTPGVIGAQFGAAAATSSTVANVIGRFPVTMRTKPTALEQSGTANQYAVTFSTVVTACSAVPVFGGSTTENDYQVNFTVASGLTAGQAGRGLSDTTNGATAYLGWSAEL
jgi:hypothetical protein